MQSSKKALGWILGQKPGWILFFLNLVWELLKVVFSASKKIRTFYDASFKSFEKVSQKTKHFFNKKSKKNTWMNSWMESWMNFVFFKLGLETFEPVSKASKKIRILNDTSFKSVEKVSKKKYFLNKKWTKSPCWCKGQKGSLLMQSSKKALGSILGQKPRWILFFLNLVWELLKVVFSASKKN